MPLLDRFHPPLHRPEIDLWPVRCAVGSPLPTLPLRLTGDLFVPVDFEVAYTEACRRRRIGSNTGGPRS